MNDYKKLTLYFTKAFIVGLSAIFSFLPLSFYQSSPLTNEQYIFQFIAFGLGIMFGYFLSTIIISDTLTVIAEFALGITWIAYFSMIIEFSVQYPGPTFQTLGYFLLLHSEYQILFHLAVSIYFGIAIRNLQIYHYLIENQVDKYGSLGIRDIYSSEVDFYKKTVLLTLLLGCSVAGLVVYISYMNSVYLVIIQFGLILFFGLGCVITNINTPNSSRIGFQYLKRVINNVENMISKNGDKRRIQWIYGLGEILEFLIVILCIGLTSYLATTYQSEFTLHVNFMLLLIGTSIFLYPLNRLRTKLTRNQYLAFIVIMQLVNFLLEYLSSQYILLRYDILYMLFYGFTFAASLLIIFQIRIKDVSKGQFWFVNNFGISILFIGMLLMFEFGNDRVYPLEFDLLNSTYFNFGGYNDLNLIMMISTISLIILLCLSIGLRKIAYYNARGKIRDESKLKMEEKIA